MTDVRFARSGDVDVAYQVVGDGPVDLLYVNGAFTHLEAIWGSRPTAASVRAWAL